MGIVATFRYFDIQEQPKPPKRKTAIYAVVNRTSGDWIGEIKWYGAWRQYCFFPYGNTVWSAGCLKDVEGFIEGLRLGREISKIIRE